MEEAFLMSIMSSVRPSVYKIKRRNVYIGLLKSVTVLKTSGGKCMRANFKESTKRSVKKERTLQFTLNVIGIFMFIGVLIRWWTVPFAVSNDLQIYYNPDFQMKPSECKEFLAFVLCAASVYFSLINVYFLGKTGKKLVYIALVLLAVFNLYMMLMLLAVATH
jgi:hypothetical protein